MEAYERADLKELEILAKLAEGVGKAGTDGKPGTRNEYMSRVSSVSEMKRKCEDLEGKVKDLIDQIAGLKAKHPMSVVDELGDEDWVRGKQEELDGEIAALT